MIRLFSRFDLILFYSRYSIVVLILSFYLVSFYKINFITQLSEIFCQNIIIKFFYSLKPKSFRKFTCSIIISIIVFIISINLFSVFPYRFPLSSQFGSVLSLGLRFWFSLILFSTINNFKGFLLHFIPEGTPLVLTIFLFLIEMVRNFIRPITLTVRLVANILAGHLLLILLSKLVFITNFMFLGYLILTSIELLVGLIQAYIFSTIIVLYFSEVH